MRATVISILLLVYAARVMGSDDGLQLVGEARLKVLLWSVYDSRLYSETGSYSPQQRPLRFEIKYLRTIRASDLVLQAELEWEQQGVDHPRRVLWLNTLRTLWPDVAQDDVLTLHLDEQGRSIFYSNGELLGQIDDPQFGVHFLDIWLSPTTSRPDLREALLGQL